MSLGYRWFDFVGLVAHCVLLEYDLTRVPRLLLHGSFERVKSI
jgi:hypothetical protein